MGTSQYNKKIYDKKYRLKNAERIRACHKKWYEDNKHKCLKKSHDWRRNNPEKAKALGRKASAKFNTTTKGIYKVLLHNGKSRGLVVCDRDVFINWYSNQKKECRYCTMPEKIVYRIIGARRLTIDRKNNDIGYIPTNIVLACTICNSAKGKYISYEDMLEIGKILEKIWKRKIQ